MVSVSDGAAIRADDGMDAGAFIKPEAAQQSAAERSEESPSVVEADVALERRGSGPFSLKSLLNNQPAPLSASVRRAHLNVYRL